MKELWMCLFLLFTMEIHAQKGKTFTVEKLSPPRSLLSENSIKNSFPFDILACSENTENKLVTEFGHHPFFNGMYNAYAQHRPFVLSPDMIWILISQGFARHIHADPEKFRHIFTSEAEKIQLIVHWNEVKDITDRKAWEKILPEFTEKISKYTGSELINLLKADFSTTTITEQIASEITIMEIAKPYFEYVAIRFVCGIPEITLNGTTKDWQKLLDKTIELGSNPEYDLSWWTEEIIPLLREFVNASKGKIDTIFWRNMFKYHSAEQYGAPNIIDGWIVKFFPYNKYGKRNNLQEVHGRDQLPDELAVVNLTYIEIDPFTTTQNTKELELCAGFIGLEQNGENYALTPKIGWMVREKQNREEQQKSTINLENAKYGIYVIDEVPDEIMELENISSLTLRFTDSIKIPEKMRDMSIGRLSLTGRITPEEIDKVMNMLSYSHVTISTTLPSGADLSVYYDKSITVNTTKTNEVPFEIQQFTNCERLTINFEDSIDIPGWLSSLKMNSLTLSGKASPERINQIIKEFPDIYLTIDRTFPHNGNHWINYSKGKLEIRTVIDYISEELLQFGKITKLDIFFPSDMDFTVPKWFKKLHLKELVLGGKTQNCTIDIKSIKKTLPGLTHLTVSDETLIGTPPEKISPAELVIPVW